MGDEHVNESVRQGDQGAVIGEAPGPQHRAGAGEGIRAPLTEEGADHAEFSVFDGQGNESVVVVTSDEEGSPAEGAGPSAEAAMADAKKPGDPLADDFSPGKH
jgi:hypothetical protein